MDSIVTTMGCKSGETWHDVMPNHVKLVSWTSIVTTLIDLARKMLDVKRVV